MPPPEVEFRLLGPLDVMVGDRAVRLSAARQRALLAILLLEAGEVVSTERIIEGIWGESAPPSARHLVQVYVSQLRGLLNGSAPILTRAPGYVAEVDPSRIDARLFERLIETAQRACSAERPADAVRTFEEALALWRGPALADTPVQGGAAIGVARLDALRLAAIEERINGLLLLGRDREVIAELEQLVVTEPYRERLWAALILALYRSGRQADALSAYQDARRRLTEDLGIEPGPDLQALQQAILRQDPALDRPRAAAQPPPENTRRSAVRVIAAVLVATAVAAGIIAWLLGADADVPKSLAPRTVGMIDAASGAIVGSVAVPGTPGAISVDADRVWVAQPQQRAIIAIDRARMEVVRTMRLPSVPYRVVSGGGRAWAGNAFDGTVTELDASGTARRFRPQRASTGRLALAYGDGSLWVGSQDDALTRVDVETGRTLAVIPKIVNPEAVTVGAGGVWVAQATRASLIRVDPHTSRVVASIPLGGIPTAVAARARTVWAVTRAANRMWRIDAATNAVTSVVDIGSNASDVVVVGNNIWVAATTGTLMRVSLRGAVLQTLTLGRAISGLAAHDGRLWIGLR